MYSFNKSLSTRKIYHYWYSTYQKANNSEDFFRHCQDKYAISTQRLIIASINHYEPKMNLKMPRSVNNIREVTINSLEYQTVCDSLVYEDRFITLRNQAIWNVLWHTGIRVGELLNLKWKDVYLDTLSIIGKGRKQRYIPFLPSIIKPWREKASKVSDYVFCTRKGKKLSYSAVYKIFNLVNKILHRNDLSPHIMRHSFATHLLSKNIPLPFLKKLLGHSSISTTSRYLHYNNDKIRYFLEKNVWI